MDCSRAFIIDWFQNPSKLEELHALAIQLNCTTGLYDKCLIRVEFPDFAYILFAEDPEPALIDRARRALKDMATIRLTKVKTIAGYQPTATTPALLIRASDLPSVLKNPAVKALGGYVEESTSVTRSRKLTALRGMSQCCWIPLSGMTVIPLSDPRRQSKEGITEYHVSSWEKLVSVPMDRRESFTPPVTSAIRVLSFDIEVFKPSQRAGGMPDPDDRANFVLCISVVVHEKSVLDPSGGRREVTLHTIYNVNRPEDFVPAGTRIHRYVTEYEMLRGFWDQVAREDPLLLLGFNVQSWDFRYIHARMKLHRITYPSSLSVYKLPASVVSMRKAHWSSDAFKNNDMLWPDIPGMVVLDLHKFYVRARPELRKHSLDYVSRHYLGRGKYPMSQGRMVSAYESGDSDELSAMAQYNIEDSMLVLDLFLSQHIFEEAAIEAITSETLIDDLYTKGMQVRALNKIYRYAKESGFVVTTSPALAIGRGEGGQLVGALVQSPSPGRYDDVAVYDIRSMYPTLLMSRNICYTTYLPEGSKENPLPSHNVYPWETKISVSSKEHEVHHAAFVSDSVHRGICPRMLTDQMILRDRIRTWSTEDHSSTVLRYIQRGVKAVSNSIIGLMGASSEASRLSFPAAAGVVYTAARTSITAVIQDVSQWQGAQHGPVVYSDTDSVLVANMGEQAGRQALLDYLNEKYSPFIFELESVGRLLLVGPKNYIMRLNETGALVYKGVDFSKRSSSDFVSQAMHEVTEMIMDRGHSRGDILNYIKQRTDAIQSEDLESFAMSATVSLAAKSVGGKLGRRLIAKGMILMPGDVVDYVVLRKPLDGGKSSGITDRTATLQEAESLPEDNGIDFDYYADKLRSSTDRLLVF